MSGLYGGHAGKAATIFPNSVTLRLRPPIGDPLYPIRRLLCLQPIGSPGSPPGPPPLIGDFIPLVVSETLIITEPWEVVPGVVYPYTGSGGMVLGGAGVTEEIPVGVYPYVGSGDMTTGGDGVTEGPITEPDSVYTAGGSGYMTYDVTYFAADNQGSSYLVSP